MECLEESLAKVEARGKVVEGMVAASGVRMRATGRGLQDTGSTAKAFDGEEVREREREKRTVACFIVLRC